LYIFFSYIPDLIVFWMPGYELSSDEDAPPVQPDNPPEIENDDDDVQPQIGPATLLLQPVQRQFDFAYFMRRSGGNTTTLFSVIREADAHLPPGPIVVYSERAGGAVRLNILHIKHIMHIVKLQLRPLQNPSSQAANLLALASTFGTEPRFDASLHTLWLEVAVTTWVIML
jgi:hypothetical protein